MKSNKHLASTLASDERYDTCAKACQNVPNEYPQRTTWFDSGWNKSPKPPPEQQLLKVRLLLLAAGLAEVHLIFILYCKPRAFECVAPPRPDVVVTAAMHRWPSEVAQLCSSTMLWDDTKRL